MVGFRDLTPTISELARATLVPRECVFQGPHKRDPADRPTTFGAQGISSSPA